jgi:hypothetical protein
LTCASPYSAGGFGGASCGFDTFTNTFGTQTVITRCHPGDDCIASGYQNGLCCPRGNAEGEIYSSYLSSGPHCGFRIFPSPINGTPLNQTLYCEPGDLCVGDGIADQTNTCCRSGNGPYHPYLALSSPVVCGFRIIYSPINNTPLTQTLYCEAGDTCIDPNGRGLCQRAGGPTTSACFGGGTGGGPPPPPPARVWKQRRGEPGGLRRQRRRGPVLHRPRTRLRGRHAGLQFHLHRLRHEQL